MQPEATYAEQIRALVDTFPPLSAEQRDKLRTILSTGRAATGSSPVRRPADNRPRGSAGGRNAP